jgi:chromosome segregation ATPase
MTWEQLYKRISERFDAIDEKMATLSAGVAGIRTDLEDIHNRVVTLEDRTAELAQAEDIGELRDKIGDLDITVNGLANEIERAGSVDEALSLLDELAESERRRERAEMLAGARAAMRVAS